MLQQSTVELTVEYLAGKLEQFVEMLQMAERSINTRKQNLQDMRQVVRWLEGKSVDRSLILNYKEELRKKYKPASVNTKIASLNSFFKFLGRNDLHMEQISIQRRVYCSKDRLLNKDEYLRLIAAAEKMENYQMSLIIQTICGTGIRVSELEYITIEAVERGEAMVTLKGKTRQILISHKLRRKLKDYAKKRSIKSGSLFVTKTGKPLDRSYIWRKMKELCYEAHVEPNKVFPHNLRHLFARTFYRQHRDLAKLADILGHSSINTTRIYIISTGQEHEAFIDSLGLVS
ncbi:MAG: tyrosine-type recombinase/integrase [Clostridiales bacterium]|nr:tyrosine-type recombinase/integrase [Clostridiales bacterium]